MINWRTLFDSVGMAWTDKGSNSRKGQVNCKCPWCGPLDPSEHLLLDGAKGYYCLRNPRQHSGLDYMYFLREILPDYNRQSLIQLLREHTTPDAVVEYRPRVELSDRQREWQRFLPAIDNQRCLDYLAQRGFADPAALCRRYDLRYARLGYWSGRLLLPFVVDGTVAAWTGRSLLTRLSPRYLTTPNLPSGTLYIPRQPVRAVVVVVEGPLDTLKVASATEFWPVTPIGLLGLRVDDSTASNLLLAASEAVSLHICLDRGIYERGSTGRVYSSLSGHYRALYQALDRRLALQRRALYIAPLRPWNKDPAEMSELEIVDWLSPVVGGGNLSNDTRRLRTGATPPSSP